MHYLITILLQFTEMGYPFGTKDIQLSVIYAHMVDFCRPGHLLSTTSWLWQIINLHKLLHRV